MNSTGNKWLEEYELFLKSENSVVPQRVTDRVFTCMQSLINPSAKSVFAKILLIQVAVGFLSLSVCHQFGINPFGTKFSLDAWFMSMWGHSACMIGCGIFFLGAGVLTAGYFLSVEEVKALRRTEFLQGLALGAVSLAIFSVFGAELAVTIAGLWLLGGLLGGFVATEAVWKLKSRAAS